MTGKSSPMTIDIKGKRLFFLLKTRVQINLSVKTLLRQKTMLKMESIIQKVAPKNRLCLSRTHINYAIMLFHNGTRKLQFA